MGKPCCKTDRTFQLRRSNSLFRINWGGFVMYCHWLSQNITHTCTVMHCNGERNYILGSINVRQYPDIETRNQQLLSDVRYPLILKKSLWQDVAVAVTILTSFRKGGSLVRTLEVSWLSSASPDECCNSTLWLHVNELRPPPTRSLSSHCSCSISLLAISCISAAAETSSSHNLWISH